MPETEDRRLDSLASHLLVAMPQMTDHRFVRSVIYSVLPDAVRTFRESFPDVQLDLVELLSEHQPAQLRSGRLHLGISRFIGSFDQPSDLRYTVLFEDPFAVLELHSSAGVSHCDADALAVGRRSYRDRAAARCELDGIVEQVAENLGRT